MMNKNKETFNQGFVKIIKQFSYDFFIVNRVHDFNCTCLTEGTNQPNPDCKQCLGTGKKILIRKSRGASQDSMIPATSKASSHYSLAKHYFILIEVPVKEHDLIIDGEDVFMVNQIKRFRSFDGKFVYMRLEAVPKKTDEIKTLNNFKAIMQKGRKS